MVLRLTVATPPHPQSAHDPPLLSQVTSSQPFYSLFPWSPPPLPGHLSSVIQGQCLYHKLLSGFMFGLSPYHQVHSLVFVLHLANITFHDTFQCHLSCLKLQIPIFLASCIIFHMFLSHSYLFICLSLGKWVVSLILAKHWGEHRCAKKWTQNFKLL